MCEHRILKIHSLYSDWNSLAKKKRVYIPPIRADS